MFELRNMRTGKHINFNERHLESELTLLLRREMSSNVYYSTRGFSVAPTANPTIYSANTPRFALDR